jgi:hypothetical protein
MGRVIVVNFPVGILFIHGRFVPDMLDNGSGAVMAKSACPCSIRFPFEPLPNGFVFGKEQKELLRVMAEIQD